MKIKRIIALVLALTMLPIALAACKSKKLVATVKISIACEDRTKYPNGYIIKDKEITLEGTIDDPPTVMEATIQALNEFELPYTLNSTGRMFASFDGNAEFKEEDKEKPGYNIEHFWEFTIGGVKNSEGTADSCQVFDGDVIEYYFTEASRKDTSSETYADQAELNENENASTTAAATTKKNK